MFQRNGARVRLSLPALFLSTTPTNIYHHNALARAARTWCSAAVPEETLRRIKTAAAAMPGILELAVLSSCELFTVSARIQAL